MIVSISRQDSNTPPFDESERGSTTDQKSYGYEELRNKFSKNKTLICYIFYKDFLFKSFREVFYS